MARKSESARHQAPKKRSVRQSGKRQPSKNQPVVARAAGYDYTLLEAAAASRVQASAPASARSWQGRSRTLSTSATILLPSKSRCHMASLACGSLRSLVGPSEPRNFMGVAERLQIKTEMISDLHIAPTAAYLLAARSTPDAARQAALERAAAGKPITPAVVRELLIEAKKGIKEKAEAPELSMDCKRLFKVLERYRDQWHSGRLTELARHLREFADGLDQMQIDRG